MPGVGKTQLAAAYFSKSRFRYAKRIWISAEYPESIDRQLSPDQEGAEGESSKTRIAVSVTAGQRPVRSNLNGVPDTTQGRSAAEVFDVISRPRHFRWRSLVVFDNAVTLESIREYLPVGRLWDVLVTSRNPAWSVAGTSHEVLPFDQSEAVRFLEHRSSIRGNTAEKIWSELGGLPLGLEQAAAFIEEAGITAEKYLALLAVNRDRVLNAPVSSGGAGVAASFMIAYERVLSESAEAAQLLGMLSYFSPDSIDRNLLLQGSLALPADFRDTVQDELRYVQAITKLRKYSLVFSNANGEEVRLHRLTQAAIRSHLEGVGNDSSARWAQDVISRILGLAYGPTPNTNGGGSLIAGNRHVPHYLAVADNTAHVENLQESAADILYRLGWAFEPMADPKFRSLAPPLLKRALAIFKGKLGGAHPKVLATLTNLSFALIDLGKHDDGYQYLQDAIKIADQIDLNEAGDGFTGLLQILEEKRDRGCRGCDEDI